MYLQYCMPPLFQSCIFRQSDDRLCCASSLYFCFLLLPQCIEGIIGGVDYSQNKVNQWTATIVEHSLTQLVKQGKPFKYIVNCAVMQKSGAGLHTASSCYWDTTTDGSCTVRWENRTMYCVVSVFAVAVNL
ncbi:dynein light chain Tctex-type 3 isoform X1 [Engraulis encrasicolus]|uniref:dynein light chain Tctex-type 3 isoform X1 n=1 Tax=Engraulis encrasicolus TaxID=184585 RepID=UPI002FD3BF3E